MLQEQVRSMLGEEEPFGPRQLQHVFCLQQCLVVDMSLRTVHGRGISCCCSSSSSFRWRATWIGSIRHLLHVHQGKRGEVGRKKSWMPCMNACTKQGSQGIHKKQKDTTVHWRGRQAIFLQSNMRSNAPSWWIGWGGAVGGPIMSSQRGSFPQILHSTSSKSNWFGLRRFGQRSNSINRNFYINIFLMSLTQSVVFLPKLLSANFGSDAILKILIDRVDSII